MMKYLLLTLALLSVATFASASNELVATGVTNAPILAQHVMTECPAPDHFGFEKTSYCKLCVSLTSTALSNLVQIAANAGVKKACAPVCAALSLTNPLEVTVCEVLCQYVGFKVFAKALSVVDLDPVYYCQLSTLCPRQDCPSDNAQCVKVEEITGGPTSGTLDTKFSFQMPFSASAPVGTSSAIVAIAPVDGSADPIGTSILLPNIEVGDHQQILFEVTPSDINSQSDDDDDDDSDKFFQEGVAYSVNFMMCEGTCGSTHSNSTIFGQTSTTFEIVAANEIILSN